MTANLTKRTRLKRAAEHPILSGLVVAAVVAIGGSVWATIKGAWPVVFGALRSSIGSASSWIVDTTSVWNWLLILLVVISVGALVVFAAAVWGPRDQPTQANPRDYRSDVFEGLRWFWNYDHSNRVTDIYPCCPDCLLQLEARSDGSFYGTARRIIYTCEHCGEVKATFEEDNGPLERRVERFIHQKLRTGTWQSAPKPQP